jgi:hypothetical protein
MPRQPTSNDADVATDNIMERDALTTHYGSVIFDHKCFRRP